MSKHIKRHRAPTTFVKGIAIREKRSGYFIVDFMRDGTRTRKCYPTLKEAVMYAEMKATEIKNSGTAALKITDRLRIEVEDVLKRLNGRATITEAVNYWLERHLDGTAEKWDMTARRYLDGMEKGGRRKISRQEKELKFNILSAEMNNPPTLALQRTDIEAAASALAEKRNWSDQTKQKYIGAGLTLLRFCRGEGKAKNTTDERAPSTWEADFIDNMMHTAETKTPGLVPALAILTFAGLRPNEILRLDWNAISFDTKLISLTGEVTKTRTTRHVDIQPNLLSWLEAYRGTGLLIATPSSYRYWRQMLMKELKIIEWPNDILRHTAATMIYARTNDVDYACAQLGHFGGREVFLRHYKGLAPKPADVAKFWAIAPKAKKASAPITDG